MIEVKITDERLHRQQPVTEFTCMSCGSCALVYTIELDNPQRITEQFKHAKMCSEAAAAAFALCQSDVVNRG